VPDGTVILDEDVTLVRNGDQPDVATRELSLKDDSILVAFVDENLTDVKLELAVVADKDASNSIAVENHMIGSGMEIAALDVADGARVRLTLTSAQDAVTPGNVHLRVRQYAADAAREARVRAWPEGTRRPSRQGARGRRVRDERRPRSRRAGRRARRRSGPARGRCWQTGRARGVGRGQSLLVHAPRHVASRRWRRGTCSGRVA